LEEGRKSRTSIPARGVNRTIDRRCSIATVAFRLNQG
jgi:hypothetical protein